MAVFCGLIGSARACHLLLAGTKRIDCSGPRGHCAGLAAWRNRLSGTTVA
jgi:hypothetical protein